MAEFEVRRGGRLVAASASWDRAVEYARRESKRRPLESITIETRDSSGRHVLASVEDGELRGGLTMPGAATPSHEAGPGAGRGGASTIEQADHGPTPLFPELSERDLCPPLDGLLDWARAEAARRAIRLRDEATQTNGELDSLSPREFERLCAEVMRDIGYHDVDVVGGSGDRGVDVRGVDANGQLVVAQCKAYRPSARVTSSDMQKFIGAIAHHRAAAAYYFTTGGFTREAAAIAACEDVVLFGRHDMFEALTALGYVEPPAITDRLLRVLEDDALRDVGASQMVVGRIVAVRPNDMAFGLVLPDGRDSVVSWAELLAAEVPAATRLVADNWADSLALAINEDRLGDPDLLLGHEIRVEVGRRCAGPGADVECGRIRAQDLERSLIHFRHLQHVEPGARVRASVSAITPDGDVLAYVPQLGDAPAMIAREDLSPGYVFRAEEYCHVGDVVDAWVVSTECVPTPAVRLSLYDLEAV